MEGDVGAREQRLVVALEGLRRLAAIEVDGPYPGVFLQERRKVIALFVADGGVEAALALAAADGVPEGNVVAQQHGEPFLIGGGQCFAEQMGHHRPEAVLGMGVVLLRFERLDAGHGAEDQRAAVFIDVGP